MVKVKKGAIVRGMPDGIVRVNPPILKQPEDHYDPSIPGKNVGAMFAYMFAGAFDGTPALNGNGSFHPDVEREALLGKVLTEVKAVSFRRGAPACSVEQARRYGERLVANLVTGQMAPAVEYAIFRYGNWYTRSNKLNEPQLLVTIPRIIRDLSVLPQNVALGSMMVTPLSTMNHSSSDSTQNEAAYRSVYGRQLTAMQRNPEEALVQLADRLDAVDLGELTVDDFHLDQVTYRKGYFPGNIRMRGGNIPSFPVLQLDHTDPGGWARHFAGRAEAFYNALRGPTKGEEDLVSTNAGDYLPV